MNESLAQTETLRQLVFGTTAPLALLVAAAVVLSILLGLLYRRECRLLSRSAGLTLTTLRILLCLLGLFALAEPIIATHVRRTLKAWVVVLVDESTSMNIADTHLSPGRQLRLADGLGMLERSARPLRLEGAVVAVRAAAEALRVQADRIVTRADPRDGGRTTNRQEQRDRADDLEAVVATLTPIINDLVAATTRTPPFDAPIQAAMGQVAGQLQTDVVDPVRTLMTALRESTTDASRHVPAIQPAIESLGIAADDLARIADTVDEAFARTADSATRRAMTEASQLVRREVAARLINPQQASPLAALGENINVRCYLFASATREVPIAQAIESLQSTTRPADAATHARRTDLASALEAAVRDLAGQPIAGVVLITDGQHNAEADVVATAERLGARGVPVFPLMIGATEPPPDAAIIEVDPPKAIYLEDTAQVTAAIKLDGLSGRPVTVRLLTADGAVVDEKTITPGSQRERREVILSHKPEQTGRTRYDIEIVPLPGEAVADNNRRTVAIDVNEDRTKLLLAEGAPRWEFRYLRNLLLRDKSVKVQWLLFDPPYIDQARPQTPITANASNAGPEADRLPDELEALNAFDVIILGDISPDDLAVDDQRRIEQFVADRGGTLVVVAGKADMPGAYAGLPLVRLIPVVEATPSAPVDSALNGLAGFKVELTAEGRASALTRLHLDADENVNAWARFPRVYWRSSWRQIKGGATVLAYADPLATGRAEPAQSQPAPADRQSENALICWQNYGLGKVLYVGWDSTWRMRYKAGDRLHHKFWGQILRWATEGKLPTGLKLVKIGTDRARYLQNEPVVVRAKFAKPDLTPITDALVSAEIRSGSQVVRRSRLQFVPGSAGMYEARFTDLPAGELEVVLISPQIEALRQPDDPAGPVRTTVVIDPDVSPETLDLAANAELLDRLAAVSGGLRITPADLKPFLARLETDPVVTVDESQFPLWDSGWLLAAFALIGTVEWVLRKRVGLL